MKSVSLSGSPRESVGKKGAVQLRREGRIPCVIYGGDKQIHFSLDSVEFTKLVFTPDAYKFNFDLDGTSYTCVVQDIQWHPVTDAILHVDFLQLIEGKIVKIKLPVNLTGGLPIGVRNGGKLRNNFRQLTLQGLPKDFPEAVNVEIANLRIGQSVRVRDINLDGLTVLEPQGAVIVGVKRARGAVLDDEEEEEEGEGEEGAEASEGGEG